MPFEWVRKSSKAPVKSGAFAHGRVKEPVAELHLWPYRSLSRQGFCVFIGVTMALLALPLMGLLGTLALWGLLPFLIGAIALIWLFLERSYKDGSTLEKLTLWSDRLHLVRHDPRRPTPREFEANCYWTHVTLHPQGGPVPNYVTLKSEGREVEIGAFLSEPERLALYDELRGQIDLLRAG